MLLFDPIYDKIVNALIEYKGKSIKEIHKEINREYEVSLPNFYKIISKLINEQIIIKENWGLSFHNRRVLWFIDIADELKKAYLTEIWNVAQLKEGQTIYHETSNIEILDGVRWDWMLQINRMYWDKEATFVYQAHPYYALWMNKTEMAFFKEANKVAKVYFLTWNTKFLDIYGASLYKKIWISSLATDDIPLLKEWYCVTVVGDFVFEVLYPKEISDYFKIFFDSIKDLKDFNPDLFHRIFEMKANCKLTMRHDSNQAGNIKKIFEKSFELNASQWI